MRVTKTIKGYIEKKVNDIYNPQIDAVGKEYHKEREAVINEIDEIVKKANAEINALLEKTDFKLSYGKEKCISQWTCIDNDEKVREITNQRRALRTERDEKIEEIILTLELGGTKADLDKMLENLK